jgi:SAM-dependent methyltransferase
VHIADVRPRRLSTRRDGSLGGTAIARPVGAPYGREMADSDDQYDALGQTYERTKYIPTGLAEQATFLAALPELTGKSVLDVACGTGFYPRQFIQRGATTVVGVDSAQEMVAYARLVEQRAPLGIVYHQYDATDLPALGTFDVVTAVWLLGYAPDDTALDQMIANLKANLAAGGTLAVLIPNPDVDWDVMADYGRYGYVVTKSGSTNGIRQPVVVHVLGDPPFEFDSFFWPAGAIDGALARGGLTEVTRAPTVVPDEREFWADLKRSPSFAVYTAKLP